MYEYEDGTRNKDHNCDVGKEFIHGFVTLIKIIHAQKVSFSAHV